MTAPQNVTPAEVGPELDGEIRVRLPVVVLEGVPTSDGRFLAPDSLTPRALPLSLLACPESAHGGDDPGPAVVIGRIDTLLRRPGPEVLSPRTGEPFPEGTFVWSGEGAIDATHPVADLVRRRFLRGVSVDLTGMDVEMVAADGDQPEQMIAHHGEIAAVTLVPIPAFGDAYLELADEPAVADPVPVEDLPVQLAASGAHPAWESTEVGDHARLPEQLVAAADEGHTGGMIALVPADPAQLAVDGGDPVEQLHLTLAYLGDDVTSWPDEQRQAVLDDAARIAAEHGTVQAEVMGHAAFNPTGAHDREPCAVYLVTGEDLPVMKDAVAEHETSEHAVFLPHITAGFGLDPSALTFVGPVVFDQLRVALGDQVTDLPLGAAQEPANAAVAAAASTEEDPMPTDQSDDPGLEVGAPDAPQPCPYGDDGGEHPATMSLLFTVPDGPEGGAQQYVAVCPEHEQQGRDAIAAEGGEVDRVVAIGDAEDDPADDVPDDAVIAGAGPRPPADWFTDPQLDGPTALHVGDDGRVFGHLAAWDVPHIGMPGRHITAPRSSTSYAYFRTGAVLCDDGAEVAVGHITLDTGHANTELGRAAAAAHYDHTGTVVADVAAGEDRFGIWVAGLLRPGVTDEQAAVLRASALSGDWRRVGSSLELVAALAVNTPGFPVPRSRVASGQPLSLVAAGALAPAIRTVRVGKLTVQALADQVASVLDERRRDGQLAAEYAALVAEVDDRPALVAALLAEVDDRPVRFAELLAELDDDVDVNELAAIAAEDGMTEEAFLSRMPPQLRESYLHGQVAARIAWGTPGDFTRCVAQAKVHGMGRMAEGACANLHHAAVGFWPGDSRNR